MFNIYLSILFIIFSLNQSLYAHSRWTLNGNLTPRSTSAGIKTGPCGGLPRLAISKYFQSGSTITVQWEEVIDHPGRFEIYFSPANDVNFVLLKTVIDVQNGGLNSVNITLPNVTCTACTLQLIQVMTEDPANPTLYYSCADIQMSGTATAPNPPTPKGCK